MSFPKPFKAIQKKWFDPELLSQFESLYRKSSDRELRFLATQSDLPREARAAVRAEVLRRGMAASWRMEPELDCPVPRTAIVRRREYASWIVSPPLIFGFSMFFLLGFASMIELFFPSRVQVGVSKELAVFLPAVVAVVALIFFLGAEWRRRKSRTLVERGTATRGVIVDKNWKQRRSGGYWEYVITYETRARRRFRTTTLSYGHLGMPITVLYSSSSPRRAMLYRDCLYRAAVQPEDACDVSNPGWLTLFREEALQVFDKEAMKYVGSPLGVLFIVAIAVVSLREQPSEMPLPYGYQSPAAELIEHHQPEYPSLALQARVHGSVRLNALIDKDGSIKELKVVSGHPLLIPAALDAVKQWRYRPTLRNGRPVEVVTTIDINFTLDP